ncbi:MAG: hypothetical protein B6D55_08355 [Candidatus Omnitrophica bacterium 4484_70.2]|nr:MAG: hypothetical protein B6D55_08355 [Candidatus Omnitrophica bacterium 4484_70.2]
MEYTGPERRKHPRIKGTFVVSYRILEDVNNADLSQTKNISEGGMLLTTNKGFPEGTLLSLYIRLPFIEERIELVGRVLESKEIVKDLIYETRICFVEVPQEVLEQIKSTVEKFKSNK